MRKYQNIPVFMSYSYFGFLAACVLVWPYHLLRNIFS
jgi:hypothetical protein